MGATLGEVRELLRMCPHWEILGEGSSSRELECLNDSLYPPWAVMRARDKPPLYLGMISEFLVSQLTYSNSLFSPILALSQTFATYKLHWTVEPWCLMSDPTTQFSAFIMQLLFSSLSPDAGVLLDVPATDSPPCSLSSAHPTLGFHYPHGAERTRRISKVPVGCASVITKPLVCADVQL